MARLNSVNLEMRRKWIAGAATPHDRVLADLFDREPSSTVLEAHLMAHPEMDEDGTISKKAETDRMFSHPTGVSGD